MSWYMNIQKYKMILSHFTLMISYLYALILNITHIKRQVCGSFLLSLIADVLTQTVRKYIFPKAAKTHVVAGTFLLTGYFAVSPELFEVRSSLEVKVGDAVLQFVLEETVVNISTMEVTILQYISWSILLLLLFCTFVGKIIPDVCFLPTFTF